MMICLLCVLTLSFDSNYSLIFPLVKNNKSEMGNWSFRGTACNLRRRIRLTADSIRTEYGTVCQRAPTAFRDWVVEFDLLAWGGENGGIRIVFMFTDEVCPEMTEVFKGFHITFNTASADKDGNTPVMFSENSFGEGKKYNTIKLRNAQSPVRIRLEKIQNRLSVQYTTFLNYFPLFEAELKSTPDFGYFTIFAESGRNSTDNNDLCHFETTPRSNYEWGHIGKNLINENRKIMDSNAVRRREAKRARRDALFVTMHRIQGVIAENDNDVRNANTRPDMKDLFRLIDEALKRETGAVTIDTLKVFVHHYLYEIMAPAGKKVRDAIEDLVETKNRMDELFKYVRDELLLLAADTKSNLKDLADESLQKAKGVNIEKVNGQILEEVVQGESTEGTPELVSKIMVLVMIVEFIGYVIFFIIKHRATHGFKKND